MKTLKIILGIIAINLTLLIIIQLGIWPYKVHAREIMEENFENSFTVASHGYFSNPDDLNEDPTISGVLINVREMQNWIQFDYDDGRMSYEDAELYFSVLEIVTKQLKEIQQNNSKQNDQK